MKSKNQQNEARGGTMLPLPECPDCGVTNCRVEFRTQTFSYDRGENAVELHCEVPVNICNQCGGQWTGAEAEDVRKAAVCQYLGRLTPDEVRGVREKCRLSQAEFSKLTGLGEASLSRWETGAQIQNASSDRLLRLISVDLRNLHRLECIEQRKGISEGPKFRILSPTPELRKRQEAFELRPTG